MVDFTGNPYLRDPRLQLPPEDMSRYRLSSLGGALANLGAGIGGAETERRALLATAQDEGSPKAAMTCENRMAGA